MYLYVLDLPAGTGNDFTSTQFPSLNRSKEQVVTLTSPLFFIVAEKVTVPVDAALKLADLNTSLDCTEASPNA